MYSFRCIAGLLVFGLIAVLTEHQALAVDPVYPFAAAAAADGTLYVTDTQLPGIWKVSPEGKLSLYFAGEKKLRSVLNKPWSIAIDAQGRIVVGDSASTMVYRFDEQNKPQPISKGRIGIPMGLGFDKSGNIIVSDLELNRILRIPADGGEPVKLADAPAPTALVVDKDDAVWVVCRGGDRSLRRIAADGKATVVAHGEPFQFPNCVALDGGGNAYVTDGYAKGVFKVDSAGKVTKLVQGAPLKNPVGLCRQKDRWVIVDPHVKGLFTFAPDGPATPIMLSQ